MIKNNCEWVKNCQNFFELRGQRLQCSGCRNFKEKKDKEEEEDE